MVIVIEQKYYNSRSEEGNHNEMGKKTTYRYLHLQIYVFLYGPIEDLFIKSRGHNLALTMITARAYGLTVA